MAKKLEEQSQAELIAYIKTLRTGEQQLRTKVEQYEGAMQGLSPAQQRGFMHVMKVYSGDKVAGAELLQEIVNSVIPDKSKETNDMTPEEQAAAAAAAAQQGQPPAAPAPDMTEAPPWAQALIAEVASIKETQVQGVQASEAQQLAALKAEATGMGYQEGTDSWKLLFDQANTDFADGDLTKAHAVLTAMGQAPAAAPAEGEQEQNPAVPTDPHAAAVAAMNGQPAPAPAPAASPSGPAPAGSFPVVAPAGASSASPAPEVTGPDLSTSGGRRAAAMKYAEAYVESAEGNSP